MTNEETDPAKNRYLDTVLETVKLPAGISDLDTGLTDVDWNALSHFRR